MNHIDTLHKVGFYCGRVSDGFWGEPQNALTNLAFVVAAIFSFRLWRRQSNPDKLQPLIIFLAGTIGIGSFIFHTMPTSLTLWIDLVPIQIFGLVCIYYIFTRHLHTGPVLGLIVTIGFLVLRQSWLFFVPLGALGGGITHVPTVAFLLIAGIVLFKGGDQAGKFLMIACIPYILALAVRTLDLPLCSQFPFGLHWLWHILTATAAGTVLYALIRDHNSKLGVVSSICVEI